MNMKLERLPVEKIIEILERCDLTSIKNMSQVNSFFKRLTEDQKLWKARLLSGKDIGTQLSEESLNKVCELFYQNDYKKLSQDLIKLNNEQAESLGLLGNIEKTCNNLQDYKKLLQSAIKYKIIGLLLLFNPYHQLSIQYKNKMGFQLTFLYMLSSKCLHDSNLFYFIKFSLELTPSIFTSSFLSSLESNNELKELLLKYCKGALLNLFIREKNKEKITFMLTQSLNMKELKEALEQTARQCDLDLFNLILPNNANQNLVDSITFYRLIEYIVRAGIEALEKAKPFFERLYELNPNCFPQNMHRQDFGLDETFEEIIAKTQLLLNEIQNNAANTNKNVL